MPRPRPISTKKRRIMIKKVDGFLRAQAKKLDKIIKDLSKTYVDDKAVAKELLQAAKKLRKGLA